MHGTQKMRDLRLQCGETNLEEDGEWESENECCAPGTENNQSILGKCQHVWLRSVQGSLASATLQSENGT